VDDSGWTESSCVLTTGSNVGSLTGTGGSVNPRIYRNTALKILSGHKIYIHSEQKVLSAGCAILAIGWTDSSLTTRAILSEGIVSRTTPTADTLYTQSAIYTNSAGYDAVDGYILLRHQYATTGDANGKVMECAKIYCIDLTAVFGAGNEPSLATLDAMITAFLTAQAVAWFDSTLPTYIKALLSSTGEYVRADDTYANLDAVVMDMSTGYVTKNAATHMAKLTMPAQFFSVPSGNQTITITSDGVFSATMDYRKRYLLGGI